MSQRRAVAMEFRCEKCGYVLTGIDAGGACPECGRMVADSLPDRRVGTPFQQCRTVKAWWRGTLMMLTRPSAAWAIARIDGRSSSWFGVASMAVAAGVYALTFGTSKRVSGSVDVFVVVTSFVVTMAAVMALSMFETGAVRFVGRRRKYAMTWDHAATVTGHASVGWVVGATLAGVGWRLGDVLPAIKIVDVIGIVGVDASGLGRVLPSGLMYLETWLLLIGWLVGYAVHEVLAYRGAMALRYANMAAVQPVSG